MPELPEVETICRGLEKAMKGRTLARVALYRKDLRIPFPPKLGRLRDVKIGALTRRAKYILIALRSGETMIVHLGMSGRMTIHPPAEGGKPGKHDHMCLTLDDGTRIVFNDPRRFGLVDLTATSDLAAHRLFRHLGPEPLEPAFTAAYLAQKCAGKKTAVKIAVMDQRVVVGVGNIYASEALHLAGIDPRRAAGSLKPDEIKKLVNAVRKTLNKAIKAGGSSLRDYVQADGELGYFQHHWAVYDKAGGNCAACAAAIARIVQGGRTTFYCPDCQK